MNKKTTTNPKKAEKIFNSKMIGKASNAEAYNKKDKLSSNHCISHSMKLNKKNSCQ